MPLPTFADIALRVKAESVLQHEQDRRDLWRAVAAAIAGTQTDDLSAMHRWADKAVEEYDSRFAPRDGR